MSTPPDNIQPVSATDLMYPRASQEFLEFMSRELKSLREARASFEREKAEVRARSSSNDSNNSNESDKPSGKVFKIEEIKERLHEILRLRNNAKIELALQAFELELRQGKFNINESVVKKTILDVAPGNRTLLDEFLCRPEREVGVKLIVQFLLKLGAEVNNDATDHFPVEYVLKRKNLEIIPILLEYRLDPSLQLDTQFVMDPMSMNYGDGVPRLAQTYGKHYAQLPRNLTVLECLSDPFYSVSDRRYKYATVAHLLRAGAEITPRVFFNLFGRGAHELLNQELAEQGAEVQLRYQHLFNQIQFDRRENSEAIYPFIQNSLIIKLLQSESSSDVMKILNFVLKLVNDIGPERSYSIFCKLKEDVIMRVLAIQSDQIKRIDLLRASSQDLVHRNMLRCIMEYAFEVPDNNLHLTCGTDRIDHLLRNAFSIAYNDRIRKSHSFSSVDELVFGMEDSDSEFSARNNGGFWLFSGYDPRIEQLLKKSGGNNRRNSV